MWTRPPPGLTAALVLYALAMAYLEAAVVVYLRAAIGVPTGRIFPIDLSPAAMPYGWIEVGREAATLVMIGAVAWIAGRSSLERLAWGAVIFGVWDIGYYAWLWAFSGWPPSVHTWDLLLLIPAPWAGPVWARSWSARPSSASAWPAPGACGRAGQSDSAAVTWARSWPAARS